MRLFQLIKVTVFTKSINVDVESATKDVKINEGIHTISTTGIPYVGPYEFTPTRETQTIEIAGKTAEQNITINPIPQNYGLITQIGNRLMVS